MPRSTFGCGTLTALWPAGQGQLHGERRSLRGPQRPVNMIQGLDLLSSYLYKPHNLTIPNERGSRLPLPLQHLCLRNQ